MGAGSVGGCEGVGDAFTGSVGGVVGDSVEPGVDGTFTDPPERLSALIRYQADRARNWYDQGERLVSMLDRRSAACTAAMAGIYRCLLDRIATDPEETLVRRLSVSRWDKTIVAARSLAGVQR